MDAEDHIQVEASSNMRASWNPRSGPTAPLRLSHTIAKGDDAVSLEAGGLLSTDPRRTRQCGRIQWGWETGPRH